MKNYVRPSIELTKFDVEDIITVSAGPAVPVVGGDISDEGASLYEAFKTDASATAAANGVVEFEW